MEEKEHFDAKKVLEIRNEGLWKFMNVTYCCIFGGVIDATS